MIAPGPAAAPVVRQRLDARTDAVGAPPPPSERMPLPTAHVAALRRRQRWPLTRSRHRTSRAREPLRRDRHRSRGRRPAVATTGPAAAAHVATPNGSDVDASPLARRAAAKNGIDLHSVHGSGPGGIVTKGDVLRRQDRRRRRDTTRPSASPRASTRSRSKDPRQRSSTTWSAAATSPPQRRSAPSASTSSTAAAAS